MLSDNLPEDLMIEIIARVPVKSLLGFKCVTKSWYILVTSSSFMVKHLELSRSIIKNHHLKLLFQVNCLTRVPYISLISQDQPCVPHNIESLPHKQHLRFYGHCDGIFCLHVTNVREEGNNRSEGNLILWNPAIKEVKLIPMSRCLLPEGKCSYMFGFGFDHVTKDYKIVQVSDWPWEYGVHVSEVYDLSTNSWRILNVVTPDFGLCYKNCHFYLNGVYYWLVYDLDGITKDFILTFNFSKEVFKTIQLPSMIDLKSGSHNIFALNERLAFVQHNRRTQKSEIWVTNGRGVEGSWSKTFEIGSLPRFDSI